MSRARRKEKCASSAGNSVFPPRTCSRCCPGSHVLAFVFPYVFLLSLSSQPGRQPASHPRATVFANCGRGVSGCGHQRWVKINKSALSGSVGHAWHLPRGVLCIIPYKSCFPPFIPAHYTITLYVHVYTHAHTCIFPESLTLTLVEPALSRMRRQSLPLHSHGSLVLPLLTTCP